MGKPPNGTTAPPMTVDQVTMMQALKVLAEQIMAGRVTGLVMVAPLEDGVVIGHYLPDGGDPYRLRGAIAEADDQVRAAYITKGESGLVDGSGAKIG